MKKQIIFLFLLFIFSKSFSFVEAEVLDHNLITNEELPIVVEIDEEYEGFADLKFCLANFDFNTLDYEYKCSIFLERFNISFNNNYFNYYYLDLNGINSGLYRLFVQLHYLDKYKKDCDKNNFVYIAPRTTIIEKEKEGIEINEIFIQNELEQESMLNMILNITNYEKNENLNITTKLFNENSSIIKTSNLTLSRYSKIILNNSIMLNNLTVGEYNLLIQVNNYSLSKIINVKQKYNMSYEIIKTNSTIAIINRDNISFNYEIAYLNSSDKIIILNDLLPQHEKKIEINNTNSLITIKINSKLVYEKFNILPQKIINNSFYVNNTIIKKEKVDYFLLSGQVVSKIFDLSKHFYMFSALIGIVSLILIYKKIK